MCGLNYLAGSSGQEILYKYGSKISELKTYYDGNYAGKTKTLKRTTDYTLM